MSEQFEVPATLAGERIDKVVAMLTGWSRGDVQELIAQRAVLVDDHAVAKSRRLEEGEVVTVLGEPAAAELPQPDPGVEVVVRHEDADVVVVAKPAGLVVHPGAGHPAGTLVNGLLARYTELRDVGDPARPGIVHRLDRDTSGLLVVARTPLAYEGLVGALAEHRVERGYVALVWGHPESPRGVVDAPIGRSVRHPTRMAVREGGRRARTSYEVRTRFASPEVALVDCALETGRTHQIRVHLQAIGHPVVGDPVYGGLRSVPAGAPAGFVVARPFLHATTLAFAHPVTGDAVRVVEPLPPDLDAVLTALGAD